MGLDVREASLIEERPEARRFTEHENAGDGLGQNVAIVARNKEDFEATARELATETA
jgi:hypothetical protein